METVMVAAWLLCWAVTMFFTIRQNNEGPIMWLSVSLMGLFLWPLLALMMVQLAWENARR